MVEVVVEEEEEDCMFLCCEFLLTCLLLITPPPPAPKGMQGLVEGSTRLLPVLIPDPLISEVLALLSLHPWSLL